MPRANNITGHCMTGQRTAIDRGKAVLSRRKDRIFETGLLDVSAIVPADEAARHVKGPYEVHRDGRVRRVYGLILKGRLIYVGQSLRPASRLYQHRDYRNERRKEHDAVFFVTVETNADALWWEAVLIDELRPEWNFDHGPVMLRRCVTARALETLLEYIQDDPALTAIIRAAQARQQDIGIL